MNGFNAERKAGTARRTLADWRFGALRGFQGR
jgi:hypothetical protein